jgi:hypothetical protein
MNDGSTAAKAIQPPPPHKAYLIRDAKTGDVVGDTESGLIHFETDPVSSRIKFIHTPFTRAKRFTYDEAREFTHGTDRYEILADWK